MIMPNTIPDSLLAPCGILCLLCHHHCKSDAPCEGCRGGRGKSAHCRQCEILSCAAQKGRAFCADCDEFPCRALADFNDFYIRRYGRAFLPNAFQMKEFGIEALKEALMREWTCPDCGGIVCIHDRQCSTCGRIAFSKGQDI